MVRRVITFMYREVKGLHQAALVLAVFAFGSQLLATIRDRLLAHTFGAGSELDLYYTAFRVPDILFVLFASVLSVYVLLPFVNERSEQGGTKAGAAVLSQLFTLFLLLYVVVAGFIALAAPAFAPYLFPGFTDNQTELISLLRILLIQPILLGLSSLYGVITQMQRRFVLYAISPLLYNVGIIIGIIYFYPTQGLNGLAWGVVLGATLHLLVQLPFVFGSGYAFGFCRKFDWSLLKRVLMLSVPRALTLSVNQIILLIFVGIASLMSAGSVSVFQFAFNLQSVPLAIIGMSYSVAAFPTLSSLYAKQEHLEFNRQLLTAFRHIIFWSIPAVGLVVVLRAQIVRVLLGSGAFDWSDTRLTAALLAVFILSLVAQALLLLLVRAFYAGGRTVLPLVTAIVSGLLSVGLAYGLLYWFNNSVCLKDFLTWLLRLETVSGVEVLVLALAFVIGQYFQLVVLCLLSSRYFSLSYYPLARLTIQAVVVAVLAGLSAYLVLLSMADKVDQNTLFGISLQGGVAALVGSGVAVISYALLGSPELRELTASFKRRLRKSEIVVPQESVRD